MRRTDSRVNCQKKSVLRLTSRAKTISKHLKKSEPKQVSATFILLCKGLTESDMESEISAKTKGDGPEDF